MRLRNFWSWARRTGVLCVVTFAHRWGTYETALDTVAYCRRCGHAETPGYGELMELDRRYRREAPRDLAPRDREGWIRDQLLLNWSYAGLITDDDERPDTRVPPLSTR